MNDKNFKIGKNDNLTKKNNRNIEKKFNYLMENITKTSVFIQRHKMYDVIGSKELNLCLSPKFIVVLSRSSKKNSLDLN